MFSPTFFSDVIAIAKTGNWKMRWVGEKGRATEGKGHVG